MKMRTKESEWLDAAFDIIKELDADEGAKFVQIHRKWCEAGLEVACKKIMELDDCGSGVVCTEMKDDRCPEDCAELGKECVMRFLKRITGIYNNEAELYEDFHPKFKAGDTLVRKDGDESIIIVDIVSDQYKYVVFGGDWSPLYEFVRCVDRNYVLKKD